MNLVNCASASLETKNQLNGFNFLIVLDIIDLNPPTELVAILLVILPVGVNEPSVDAITVGSTWLP